MPKRVICHRPQGAYLLLKSSEIYEVTEETSLMYAIKVRPQKIAQYYKNRFYEIKEIEVKTPPEPCKCKQTSPVKLPISDTSRRIVANNLASLTEGLRFRNTSDREAILVLETCLFILKGE